MIDSNKLSDAIAELDRDEDFDTEACALVLDAARAYAPLMQDVSRFIAFTRALGAVVTTEAQGATGDKAALLHTIALLMRGLQRGN